MNVISIEKSYEVYQLELTPRTKEYFPPLKQQLEAIAKAFTKKYGAPPQEMIVGPVEQNGQTFIRTGEVYVPLFSNAETQAESLEGQHFSTGYVTVDPSYKTHGG